MAVDSVDLSNSGQEDEEKEPESDKYHANVKTDKLFHGIWDTMLFGLLIKWTGFAAFWHYALVFGFREFMIAFAVITVGYGLLLSSLAEMVSVIAFPGGYYGYARCAVHPFVGYLVGCCGIIESVMAVAGTADGIGQTVTYLLNTPHAHEPYWWLITHAIAIAAHVQPRSSYWYMMMIISGLCAVTVAVYLLGSIPKENYNQQVDLPEDNVEMAVWTNVLVSPAMFYCGIDLMVVTSHEVKDSKTVVPRGMLWTYLLAILLALGSIFTVISQSPGLSWTLFTNSFGFSWGFAEMLGIDVHLASAYAILPLASSMLGYMFVGGRMIKSMAKSGLLPKVLNSSSTGIAAVKTPLVAMIATSVTAIAMQAVCRKYTDSNLLMYCVFYGAFFGYLGMLICYIVFRYRYSNLERTFRSPFGTPGAVIGIVIFVFAIVSVIKSAMDNIAACTFAAWMGAFIVYYLLYGERNQTFNTSEQQAFFKAYLINMNLKRRAAGKSKYSIWRALTGRGVHKAAVVPGGSDHDSSDLGGSDRITASVHTSRRAGIPPEVPAASPKAGDVVVYFADKRQFSAVMECREEVEDV